MSAKRGSQRTHKPSVYSVWGVTETGSLTVRQRLVRSIEWHMFCTKSYSIPTFSGNMAKVDSKGRIVLPQEVREKLGISPGDDLAESTKKNSWYPAENARTVHARREAGRHRSERASIADDEEVDLIAKNKRRCPERSRKKRVSDAVGRSLRCRSSFSKPISKIPKQTGLFLIPVT